MPAWEHFNVPFNFDATSIGPIVCPVIIHNKPGTRLSWDFRGRQGFNIGPALQYYRCFHVVDAVTKYLLFSDTVELFHGYFNEPTVSPADRIVRALNFLLCAIKDVPASVHHEQISSISGFRDFFSLSQPRTRSHIYPFLSLFCLSKAIPHFHLQGRFHLQGAVTKYLLFSDTVELFHGYFNEPTVSPADRIVRALNFLLCAIKDVPASVHHEQISSISGFRDFFSLSQPRTRSHIYPFLSLFCLSKAIPHFHLQGRFHLQGWTHLQGWIM